MAEIKKGNFLTGDDRRWADVRAERAFGVVYTNTTGRALDIAVSALSNGLSAQVVTTIEVNGEVIYATRADDATDGSRTIAGVIIAVPSSATYKITSDGTVYRWAELK